MTSLRRRQFGDPILRTKARDLTTGELASKDVQDLITKMKEILRTKKYGVGLAAPQIGESIAISVVDIKPTPSRPNNPEISFVIVNPKIVKTVGKRTSMWEGCVSFGGSGNFPYAKALRYKKVIVEYLDDKGHKHTKLFDGIEAHVVQHEIDHLNGVLFVDRVKDTKSYMTVSEYKKLLKRNEVK